MMASTEVLAEKIDRIRQLGAPLSPHDFELLYIFLNHVRELDSRDHGVAVFVAGLIEWTAGLGYLHLALEFAEAVPDEDFALLDDALGDWGRTHEIFWVLNLISLTEKGDTGSAIRAVEDISSQNWRIYALSVLSHYFLSIGDCVSARKFKICALESLDYIGNQETRELVHKVIPALPELEG